jgi:hypothetical protein
VTHVRDDTVILNVKNKVKIALVLNQLSTTP